MTPTETSALIDIFATSTPRMEPPSLAVERYWSSVMANGASTKVKLVHIFINDSAFRLAIGLTPTQSRDISASIELLYTKYAEVTNNPVVSRAGTILVRELQRAREGSGIRV